MTKTATCPNCHIEMERVTLREWVAAWTGYSCPGCHFAIPDVEVAEAEAVVGPVPKSKRKRKAKVDAEVVESEVEDE